MKRLGPWSLALALIGLLAVSAVTLTLGQRETISNPDATSTGPSGAAAFAELLRRQGYEVSSVPGSRFRLTPDTLAIGLCVKPPSRYTFGEFEDLSWSDLEEDLRRPFEAHLQTGGKALLITVPRNFQEASLSARTVSSRVKPTVLGTKRELSHKPLQVDVSTAEETWGWSSVFPWLDEASLIVLESDSGEPVLRLHGVERGICGYMAEGLGVTNRFVARADNARLFLGCVGLLANPKGKVAFIEAAHGVTSDASLFEVLGPWAEAIWWQAVFLFVLLVYAFGRRFGLPILTRSREAGSSDLAGALSGIMARARGTHLAMEVLVQRTDRDLRRHLKLAADAPQSTRDEALPEGLRSALREAEILAKERSPRKAALMAAQRLERELMAFLGTGRLAGRRNG